MKISKTNINLLPKDIINYILLLAGYHKFRNGKFICQLDKTTKIFEKIKEIPLFLDYNVDLLIKTQWFRRSFCDKIISLYTSFSDEYENNGIYRNYICGWYEYDFSEERHLIKIEEEIFDV